jgi:hypothetical protein
MRQDMGFRYSAWTLIGPSISLQNVDGGFCLRRLNGHLTLWLRRADHLPA